MDERDWLAGRFEEKRAHLRAVAYRMLGSESEADDAVQEAWLRVGRSDTDEVENLGGWMTTIVARVSLDMLRSRKSRREEAFDVDVVATTPDAHHESDAEREAMLAGSIGPALHVVLETLAPAERVAFVLHDMFAVPFDEIARIVGRTPGATRQLASRARRRVQGRDVSPAADRERQRRIVEAFLAASRNGDFAGLLAVLDPDVVARGDEAAVAFGAIAEVNGAQAVAETFVGRARGARPALIAGEPGLVWAPGGTPRVAFVFTVDDDRIVEIEFVADPERLRDIDMTESDS
jgi:RNA polymerase sigma-70 factor (ECF subfamily)